MTAAAAAVEARGLVKEFQKDAKERAAASFDESKISVDFVSAVDGNVERRDLSEPKYR